MGSMDSHSDLRKHFTHANANRNQLQDFADTSGAQYQEHLQTALSALENCRRIINFTSLFSTNETEDDVSSEDLQYLLVDYYLGELVLKISDLGRKTVLERAQAAYERFLKILDSYRMLSESDEKLYERFCNDRDQFSLVSSSDPGLRRDIKIARYKQEKELKFKLDLISKVPFELRGDDETLRELHLAEIQLNVHYTFQALDQIVQELAIIALMPKGSPAEPEELVMDHRERSEKSQNTYSERLDPPISKLMDGTKSGPILSKDGKPLRPFTLLDNRQRLQKGVFRPGHNLPSMTIDEYLEEEKRRGGIIDGGGQTRDLPEPDEDDVRKADVETMRAREWDEFVDANPKGSGNTMNRG